MKTAEPKSLNGRSGIETKPTEAKPTEKHVQITPPKIEVLPLKIIGTAPLVQHKFGEKARKQILDTQEAGSQAKKGKKRDPKNFEQCYQDARHVSTEGWDGIHAGGFRRAMVDACKLVGFFMTRAKLGLFIKADGFSADGTPLVNITKGKPTMRIHEARNSSGVIDLRARPMWDAGWEAIVTIEYDSEMFNTTEVVNLMARVGIQCGIGEGRPNSKDSTGCGWGTFKVECAPKKE